MKSTHPVLHVAEACRNLTVLPSFCRQGTSCFMSRGRLSPACEYGRLNLRQMKVLPLRHCRIYGQSGQWDAAM